MRISRLSPVVSITFLLAAIASAGCSPTASAPKQEAAVKPEVKPPATQPNNQLANDLRRIQGTWEREVRPEEKVPYTRVVKQVEGNRERVTYYNADGSVWRAHEVDFRLERQGRVKVFTFFNHVVTDGPDKGKQTPEPKSFIYRVTNNTFDEVWGFLPEQNTRTISYHVHKRVRTPQSTEARPTTAPVR